MAAEHRRYELALQIGTEANQQHLWRQALTALRIARQGMPYDARVYAALGDACLGMALYQHSLTCYKIAVRLNRKEPLYLQRVADIQLFLGQREEAAQTLVMLGRHYRQQENADDNQLRSYWERAIELAPDLLAPRWWLAQMQLRQNDTAGGVTQILAMADILERHNRLLPALHLCHLALYLRPQDKAVAKAVEKTWHSLIVGRTSTPTQSPTAESGRMSAAVLPGSLLTAALSLAQWQLTQEVRRLPAPVDSSIPNTDVHHVLRHGALQHALYHETRGNAGGAVVAYERAIAYGLRMPAAFFALGLLYRLVGRESDARCVLRLAAQDPFYRQAVTLIGYI
jgi:tetratricopeptide (TPR) repeat protein